MENRADGDGEGENLGHVTVDAHVVHRGEGTRKEKGVPIGEVDGVFLVLETWGV